MLEELHLIRVRYLGWGLLLAWVFCTFYTDVALNAMGSLAPAVLAESNRGSALSVLPVLSAIAALAALVFVERRLGAVVDHPVMLWVSAAMACASTPLLFLGQSLAPVAYGVGAIGSGMGSAVLWVGWGIRYAGLSQEDVELHAPASALAAAVVILVSSSMSGVVGIAFVALLPVASVAMLQRSLAGAARMQVLGGSDALHASDAAAAHDRLLSKPARVSRLFGRSGWGVLLACLFACVAGGFWEQPANDASGLQIVMIAAAVLMLVVGMVSVSGPRRISVSFVFRWICPLLVTAFAALAVYGDSFGPYIANGISLAARFAFCTITQMYFARFAARGLSTATQSYGWGWICVHAGDLLGVIALLWFSPLVAADERALATFAIASIVALVFCTMLVLGDDSCFKVPSSASEEATFVQGAGSLGVASSAAYGGEGPRCANADLSADADTVAVATDVTDASSSEHRLAELSVEFGLTQRETEVFVLLMRGRSVPYIRDELSISRDTVATHVKHIYVKADVHSRQELLDLAL